MKCTCRDEKSHRIDCLIPLSVPAIEDPNTGIKLWESGAIIEYLIDAYDNESKLSIKTTPEKYYTSQYLFFQVSGYDLLLVAKSL